MIKSVGIMGREYGRVLTDTKFKALCKLMVRQHCTVSMEKQHSRQTLEDENGLQRLRFKRERERMQTVPLMLSAGLPCWKVNVKNLGQL